MLQKYCSHNGRTKVPGLNTRNRIITELRAMFRWSLANARRFKQMGNSSKCRNCWGHNPMPLKVTPTRKSIDEHRESRDPNHPRDFIDCYLNQVIYQGLEIYEYLCSPLTTRWEIEVLFIMKMEHDKEFDQEGLELTCLDLFKVSKTFSLIVVFLKLAIHYTVIFVTAYIK